MATQYRCGPLDRMVGGPDGNTCVVLASLPGARALAQLLGDRCAPSQGGRDPAARTLPAVAQGRNQRPWCLSVAVETLLASAFTIVTTHGGRWAPSKSVAVVSIHEGRAAFLRMSHLDAPAVILEGSALWIHQAVNGARTTQDIVTMAEREFSRDGLAEQVGACLTDLANCGLIHLVETQDS